MKSTFQAYIIIRGNNNYEKEKERNEKIGGLEKEFKNMQPIIEF